MTWDAQLPPRRRWSGPVRKLVMVAAAIGILAAAWFAFWNAAPLPLNGRPVIAYKLRSRARGGLGPEGPGYFHLYLVEQTIGSVPPDVRSKLIDTLSSNSSYTTSQDRKFDAVVGFSFGIGSDRTDVLYSPTCRKVWYSRGNELARRGLSEQAVRQLNAIYEQLFHGDPIAAGTPLPTAPSTQ